MANEHIVISLYLFFGVCFGFATFSHRQLFSEGPERETQSEKGSELIARIFWIAICAWLWPIMVFTGMNTALILAKRKKLPAQKP